MELESIIIREQYFIDLLFKTYPNHRLNLSVTAGSTYGLCFFWRKNMKHKPEFRLKRSGKLNPMYDREKSSEFIAMQIKDKSGINNPQYGVIKKASTIDKLVNNVYVYDALSHEHLGTFSTVECKKHFRMGCFLLDKKTHDTLKKYLDTRKAYLFYIIKKTKIDIFHLKYYICIIINHYMPFCR